MESDVSEDSRIASYTSDLSTPRRSYISNKKRRKQKFTPHSRRKNSCVSSSDHVFLSLRKKLDQGTRLGLGSVRTTLKNIKSKISRQRISSSFHRLLSKSTSDENNRFCIHIAVSTVAAFVGNAFLGGAVGIGQAAQVGAVSALSVLATETIMKKNRRRERMELNHSSSPMTMDEVMDIARWQSSETF